MAGLEAFLRARCLPPAEERAGAPPLLPLAAELEAGEAFGLSPRKLEAAALEAGLLPRRYERNALLFGLEGQRRLHAARVVIAGLGGLGGYVLEYALRLGIGRVLAYDPDRFDESNLNRQLLATRASLGRPKAEAAAARAALVNPAVDFEAAPRRLEAAEAATILPGAFALVDALDGIGDRLSLAAAASAAGVAFVHAAVAGFAGQACVQAPGAADLGRLYPAGGPERGVERSLGNQAFAPAFAAALEASELCRLVLGGEGRGLGGRCLFFDLAVPEFLLMEG